MEIAITNLTSGRVASGWLCRRVVQVIRKIKVSTPVQLSIVFVDPSLMRKWNRTYLGRDYATDVLSFDLKDPRAAGLNGEILVCVAEARKIARSRGTNLNSAFLWLIIHGILHLAGYEHERVSLKKAKKMLVLHEKLATSFHV